MGATPIRLKTDSGGFIPAIMVGINDELHGFEIMKAMKVSDIILHEKAPKRAW